MSKATRGSISKIHKNLNKIIELKKPLKIIIVPAKCLQTDDDDYAFGLFVPYEKRAEIYIAGHKLETYYTKNDHISYLIDVLSHELAHYYQWINRKKLQERGVEIRAKKYKEKMYEILKMKSWYAKYVKNSKTLFEIKAQEYDI